MSKPSKPDADWEKMRNDVEIIKARVSSLDRITVLQNRQVLVADLKRLIGTSTIRAAVLSLTRNKISRVDLAAALGVDGTNVTKYTNPFTGAVGYIYELREGGRVTYMRDEKLDILEFEQTEPFKGLLEQWRTRNIV